MDTWAQALAAYQSNDPAGWVNVYKIIPVWGGILLIALGVVLLIFGGGKWFRLVAGPMAAAVGFLWMPVIFDELGFELSSNWISWVAGVGFAAMGFLFPPGAAFVSLGIPAGLLAGQMLPQSDWFLGFVPTLLLCGTAAALLHRYVGSVAASLTGGWLFCIGTLATLHFIGSLVGAVSEKPWYVIVAAVIFAIAGSVYQLAIQVPPEEAARLRLEQRRERQRAREKQQLEQRWQNYSSNRK